VGFTVSPEVVSNTFSGTISVTVTGLAPRANIRLSKFLDANANGLIDPGEPLVASFGFTDGRVTTFQGVRLAAVPGDEDLNTINGQIVARFPPVSVGELERITAPYLYRVSHPTGAFPPVVKPFTITNSVFGQALTGTVLSDGAPVPSAGVAALAGLDGRLFAGVGTDASGQYSLSLPPGTYQLVAFREGYVGNFREMPVADLGAGQIVTNDLLLTAATRTVSGQLQVLQNTNVIPGIQGFCEASSGEFTLGFTDTNGNFSFGVTSNVWDIEPAEDVAAAHGLLVPRNPLSVDATTGDVSGLLLKLPSVNALFHGTVRDDQNNPVAGLSVWANTAGQPVPYESTGMTDGDGNYSVGVLGMGTWWVGFSDEDLFAAGLLLSGTNVSAPLANQAKRVDFLAQHATAHLRGLVQMPDGSTPSNELRVVAWSNNLDTGGATGEGGTFHLLAVAGNWTLQLAESGRPDAQIIGSLIENLTVTDGADITNLLIVARPLTAQITGRVTGDGNPLGNLFISAEADFGTNHYEVMGYTDPNGYYALDVADGTWRMGLNCTQLQGRGYPCAPEQNVVVAGADQVRDFTLVSPPEPPTLSSPAMIGGQFQFRVDGQSGRQYRVWSTEDLVNWVDEGTSPGPSFLFTKPVAPGSAHRFYGVEVMP